MERMLSKFGLFKRNGNVLSSKESVMEGVLCGAMKGKKKSSHRNCGPQSWKDW